MSADFYKIYLDTSKKDHKSVRLLRGAAEIDVIEGDIDVVSSMEKLLKNNNLSIDDIDEVVPFKGPGSFTGLKIGVTVANIINWAKGKKKLSELDYPEYGSEPNIQKRKEG